MEDIAPKLLEKLQEDFKKRFDDSRKLKSLYKKIGDGTANYKEAQEFAIETGEILKSVFEKGISSSVLPDGRMYYNIADRVIRPMLENNYDIVADVSAEVQTALNKSAGIGIKAIKPEMKDDKVQGIVDIVSGKDNYDDISYMLGEPVVNFTQSVVDDAVRLNADFQYNAGMSPKIIRTSSRKCCDWCDSLDGIYEYEKIKNTGNDVFRRHKNCRCLVEYDPGTGKRQNAHTKKWSKSDESDKIKIRKNIGLAAEDDIIIQDIRENIIPEQNISEVAERQQIHRIGTDLYEARKQALVNRGEFGPSYITVSDDKILELVKKYSGKGKIKYNRRGEWTSQETILTNDEIVGVVVDNRNGNSAETSVFKIHYAKDGIHIVPDYPSKKR